MYDGYYIYSPYKNTWDVKTIEEQTEKTNTYKVTDSNYKPTYQNGDNLYGLKPYVYYSCRYKKGKIDVVITYSLDNYVEIQGKIDNKAVSQYGYVLNMANDQNDKGVYVSGDNVYYNSIMIEEEEPLSENVYVDGEYKYLQYVKVKGVKYYKDGDIYFSVLNGKKQLQNQSTFNSGISNAKKYYKEAYELYKFINNNGLDELTTMNIEASEEEKNEYYSINGKIFNYISDIEAEDSNFNTHRIDVIKNAITKNLSVAISNFNNYSGVLTDFQMPKLKDTDWDKIMDNISVISFFQGASIGGKVYNGYSIVTNTKNEDVVMEDSIYIKNDNVIYRITDNELHYSDGTVGIFNVNLEKKSGNNDEGSYYLPVEGTLSYDSIVTQNNIAKSSNQSLREYITSLDDNLKKVYYTALGRERYGLYRPQLLI